jgi:hypothetical protein
LFEVSHIFAYAVISLPSTRIVCDVSLEKKMTIVDTAVHHFSYQNCPRSFDYIGKTLLSLRQAAPAPPWYL